MAHKKKKIKEEGELNEAKKIYFKESIFDLHPQTKKSIVAVVLLALAFIIVLSFFDLSGPLGEYLYKASDFLFGFGAFLLPIIIFIVAFIFLLSERQYKIYFTSAFGTILFLSCSLGIIEIFYPEKGGLVGKIVSYLKAPLGFWASIILLFSFLIVSILMLFNAPLDLKKIWRRFFQKYQYFPEDALGDGRGESESNLLTHLPGDDKENYADGPSRRERIIKERPKELASQRGETDYSKKNLIKTSYKLPSIDLLEGESGRPTTGDIKANANIIKRTLENFGIYVEMGEVNIGPTVTRYTLKPAEGMKLSRIVALQNDLSLSLAAHPIRIEAPIPGKSLVGIEVPNRSVTLVRVRNLINTDYFRASFPLVFPVGRDVAGEPIYANLDKMPHLLIAGATGTGKSVCIHSVICSYLFKNSPETLNFILIDPKRVELTLYNGLPHLITPVIVEPKKAIIALKWATQEMDRRYDLLLKENCRDIAGFNQKMSRRQDIEMPYIVIIIDELADLMAMFGREVEASIIRLAQMARATGIHLVVSTQRPSVEVITGLIKANITSRIAFQVASQVDSRTILDTAGAEKLLGNGDMLFMSSDSSRPRRIQGVFVAEKEIRRVVDFIIEENTKEEVVENESAADLTEALLKEQFNSNNISYASRENFGERNFDEENYKTAGKINLDDLQQEWRNENEDELYDDAYKAVVEAKKASASYLQRRLRIGYARAARLLDILEERGVIGPGEGAKPREVYVEPEKIESRK